jgi:hypothetical protein
MIQILFDATSVVIVVENAVSIGFPSCDKRVDSFAALPGAAGVGDCARLGFHLRFNTRIEAGQQ